MGVRQKEWCSIEDYNIKDEYSLKLQEYFISYILQNNVLILMPYIGGYNISLEILFLPRIIIPWYIA